MLNHLQEVLVVDDDRFTRRIAAMALAKAAMIVYETESGNAALSILRERPNVRLVVCDWVLPDMTGLDFVRALRQDSKTKPTFVLICTSNNDDSSLAEALAAGADDYVEKPWRESELVARVRSGQQRIALDTSEALIFSLAALADSRDPETGAHLERVKRYCGILARSLAEKSPYAKTIDGSLARLIEQTSILHDIGKVGIPDVILRKPGKLTNDEFDIMKSHTSIGARTLDAALKLSGDAPFLAVARAIALHHHERWDGAGYPSGLSREQIPLPARILAVADVYDALRSKRVYKSGYSHAEALDTIHQNRESQFDPIVVDAFDQNERQFDEVRTALIDED